MEREVEVYARWADHPMGEPEWLCGSGYVLGGRLVLTAAHVVCRDGRPLDLVQIRGETGELLAARVRWHRDDEHCDAALVEVVDQRWPNPRWRQPVRWGRLVTTLPERSCEATGFPDMVADPGRRRDTHHAVGVINPRNLRKSGRCAIEVTNPPRRIVDTASPWAGMSGAAVFAEGLLIGVIEGDPAGFASYRLTATPITAFLQDSCVQTLIVDHTGFLPGIEPVELVALSESPQPADSPVGLLRADIAPMRFRQRTAEMDALLAWARTDVPWSAMLIAGPGGQGKSRLAREFSETLAASGWVTLNVGHQAADGDLTAVLSAVSTSTLVVVDYAEARLTQLAAVRRAMALAEPPVRLLLLARTADSWRIEHPEDTPDLDFLASIDTISLGPLEESPEGREEAWRDAVITLAPLLGGIPGYQETPWAQLARQLSPPALIGSRYRTVLEIYIDALAALLRLGHPALAGVSDPLEVLLAHERRYWSRVARQFAVTLGPAIQRCAVAYATLYGAATRHEADRVLATIPGVRDLGEGARVGISNWLATLYRNPESYWSRMQPDRMAEYLIGSSLGPSGSCGSELEDSVHRVTENQVEHAIALLAQAMVHQPALATTVSSLITAGGLPAAVAAIAIVPRAEQPQPLLHALSDFVATAPIDTIDVIHDRLPRHSLILGSVALTVAVRAVSLYRELVAGNRDAYLPGLAGSVNNLAVRLVEVGRGVEGLAAAREAVDLCRELVAGNRDAYLSDLAMSVNNLANLLGVVGRGVEGLAAAREAVDLCRELVAGNRDAYLSDLAGSVHNLAVRLGGVGRGVEGLAAAEEAVDLCRELVAGNRDAYLPGLAGSVHNLANRLAEVGRGVEGLAAAEEAVDLCRELVAGNRDAYLSDLAGSVHNLAVRLGGVGRGVEGLAAAEEAVDLYRELVAGSGDAYLPNLASSQALMSALRDEQT